MLRKLIFELNEKSNKDKALILQRFFKIWPWEYWEWDIFLWITVPIVRNIAKKYLNLSFKNLEKLLHSNIHEYRFVALCILRINFEKSKDELFNQQIINFTFKNILKINNWDLVDLYIPYVFWRYFFNKDKKFIYEYIKSDNLWIKRIWVMTCFYDIKNNQFDDIIKISELLLYDKHDLIHKCTWWMLRETWKRNINILYNFLDKYYKIMPRTMLRYSIEKLDKDKKTYYMKK